MLLPVQDVFKLKLDNSKDVKNSNFASLYQNDFDQKSLHSLLERVGQYLTITAKSSYNDQA